MPGPDLPELAASASATDAQEADYLNVLFGEAYSPTALVDALIINALFDAANASDSFGISASAFLSAIATAADGAFGEPLANLMGRASAIGSAQAQAKFSANISQTASANDAIASAWAMLIAETSTATDTALGITTRLVAIVDTLRATGLVDGKLSAMVAIATAATADGIASAGWSKNLTDTASVADLIAGTLKHITTLLDSVIASDSAAGIMQVTALLADSAVVDDDVSAQAFLQSDLADSAMIYASIRIDGADYSAWMMNTDLRAFTERKGVSFDSVIDAGGRHFAAGPDGIFEITGTTDNGEPIDGWLRTFLSEFGTAKMKRTPDIYVGYSGTDMLLKMRTRDSSSGELFEDWYMVERRQLTGDGNGRAKVGRGLKSVWWGMELRNINGADFAIDNINWRPLILDRRI